MMKKLTAAALLLTVAFTGAACSSKNDSSTASPAASQAASPAASVNPDAYKLSAYTAVRLAEEKVNVLFHQVKQDEKPVMNNLIAADKEKATKFLNAYFDPAMSGKLLDYYMTADKSSKGAVIVKAEPFFASPFAKAAPKQEDVTFEGTADEVKLTTKENTVYTVKKNAEGKYVVADYAKK